MVPTCLVPPGARCPGRWRKTMHPGFYSWWKSRQNECEQYAGCGGPWSSRGHSHDEQRYAGGYDDSGGAFGVRRPLRFLAYKLQLDERQVAELARILSDLKTERAQAHVDERRTTAAFAEAIAGATFDEAKAADSARDR